MRTILLLVALTYSIGAWAADTLITPGTTTNPSAAKQMYLQTAGNKLVPAVACMATDGNSNLIPMPIGTGAGTIIIPGRSSVGLARNVYSSVNVGTGAYVQLVASTSDTTNHVHIFDSSGQTLVLATGAALSESNKLYIPPGGISADLTIASGTRVSIKAISGTANTGEINITFLK